MCRFLLYIVTTRSKTLIVPCYKLPHPCVKKIDTWISDMFHIIHQILIVIELMIPARFLCKWKYCNSLAQGMGLLSIVRRQLLMEHMYACRTLNSLISHNRHPYSLPHHTFICPPWNFLHDILIHPSLIKFYQALTYCMKNFNSHIAFSMQKIDNSKYFTFRSVIIGKKMHAKLIYFIIII